LNAGLSLENSTEKLVFDTVAVLLLLIVILSKKLLGFISGFGIIGVTKVYPYGKTYSAVTGFD